MFGVEGAVIKQSLVLVHAHICWNVVVFAPSTKRMEKQNWVFETQLDELLTGVLQQENVSIVERISHLEGVNCVSALGLNLGLDLSGGQSEVVDTIIEVESLEETHAGA